MSKLIDIELVHAFSSVSAKKSAKIHQRYGYIQYSENSISEHEAAVIRMMTRIIVANFPNLRKSSAWYLKQEATEKKAVITVGIHDCFYVQRQEKLQSAFSVAVIYKSLVDVENDNIQQPVSGKLTKIIHFLEVNQNLWQTDLLTVTGSRKN